MPCTGGGPSEQDFYKEWLCEALSVLEENDLQMKVRKDLQDWWKRHRSREHDRTVKEAMAKLTPRERLALGLDEDGKKKP